MAAIDAVAESVHRIQKAQEEGRIPKDIDPDVAIVLQSTRARLTILKATANEPSDEVLTQLRKILSAKSVVNLVVSRINSLDELCFMTAGELEAAFEKNGVSNKSHAVRLIRRELERNDIIHNLGQPKDDVAEEKIDLDALQMEAERLVTLLKEREPSMRRWKDAVIVSLEKLYCALKSLGHQPQE